MGWFGYTPPGMIYDAIQGNDNPVLGDMGAPSRTGGEYEGVNQGNFNLPGYQQRNDQLGAYAQQYAADPFRQQQQGLAGMLMAQAQGQNSLSAEQLRQNTQRLQGQQQSMAAGARPQNQGMASRLAMQNAGQLGASMSGQQAMAGIAERNAAAQSLGGVLQGARGLDQSAYLGAQGMGMQNAGLQQAGMMGYEGQRTQRYGAAMGVPTQGEKWTGMLQSGLQAGAMMSDVRVKKNIAPGGGMAASLANATAPSSWEYKQGAGPSGQRVGPMAQQLEKAVPGSVVNSQKGKAIKYGELMPEMWAMAADANRRAQRAEAAARGIQGGEGLPPGYQGFTPRDAWADYLPPRTNPRDVWAESPASMQSARKAAWDRYLQEPRFDVQMGQPVIGR